MNADLSFEEIVELYLDCCRNGSRPDIPEFAEKYPQYKDELLDILPLLNDLEEIGGQKKCENSIPELIDSDYQLIRKIGAGGMGMVFEALQVSLDRSVAVKILSPSLVKEQSQREQFENEAKIIAMLHHPNIVKILSAGCTQDCCYYAMDLIEGKSLNQCNITDIREIANIALQACKAVAYAHSCNVMHRDIKPSNLMLDNTGTLLVSDFGLAYVLKDKKYNSEKIDPKSGTIRYMAPEKLSKGENSYYTDQYSLGVTLYELVTRTPFISANTPKELADKIRYGRIPHLNGSNCKEKDFAAIINKAISFKPENRYLNMEEMAEDIERFLNYEPVKAYNPSPAHRFMLWKKRKPLAAVLSFVSGICAAAFVAALITGYIQTNSALKLAQKNADTADAALSKIFNYVETQPPSKGGSVLLDTLMPYYQEISEQSGIPKDKLIEANKIVGLYAMRSGNYNLAAKSYNRLVKLQKDAASLNNFADALQKLGRKKEANEIRLKLINQYANSSIPQERYEAVRALTASGSDRQKEYQAYCIIEELLANDTNNPDYLYQYAVLLGKNPDFARGGNPFGILNNLANKYPDNPEYGIALIEFANNNLDKISVSELNAALELSEKLAGQFPNTPKVISSVVKLKKSYIRILRRNGEMAKARKETEHLLGTLETHYYNPQTPDTVKETLIRMQLERLNLFKKTNHPDAANDMTAKIRNELKSYNGSYLQEFYRRLD